jgi:hypothetical protein
MWGSFLDEFLLQSKRHKAGHFTPEKTVDSYCIQMRKTLV